MEETKPEAKEEAKAETTASVAAPQSDAVTPATDKTDAGKDVKVPAKFKSIVDEVEKMSVIELHELVKLLEEKWGVSAAAVVAGPAGGVEAGEEKSAFTVHLASAGEQKIAVMKVVKEVLGLGLKEAKDLVDGAPVMLKEAVKKEEAEEIKKKIDEVGGKVELK